MKSLCLLGLLVSCHGSLLIRDPTDPCTAYGNGTTFNISSLGRVYTTVQYNGNSYNVQNFLSFYPEEWEELIPGLLPNSLLCHPTVC